MIEEQLLLRWEDPSAEPYTALTSAGFSVILNVEIVGELRDSKLPRYKQKEEVISIKRMIL